MMLLSDSVSRLIPSWAQDFSGVDPNDHWYAATISVWVRWAVLGGCLLAVNYRVEYGSLSHLLSTLFCLSAMVANWFLYCQIRSRGTVRRSWLLLFSAMDIAAISVGVWLSGGFDSYYFLLYYPAVAFSWLFLSRYLCLVWTSGVGILYFFLCLGVEPGLNFQAQEERMLFFRILVLTTLCGSATYVMKFEQARTRGARAREQELNRQRIELSQDIHDTTAQSAYLLGLGVETALELAGKSNRELSTKLKGMGDLSRSLMWELRHPIDGGEIFNGLGLTQTLRGHADTFSSITSIPADLVQEGTEPQLPTLTRSLVFSIAHNALTNVYRHAHACWVTIRLDYEEDHFRMSVTDDGIGLPENYMEQGHGIKNMIADAERAGGRLDVISDGSGTSISCIVPYEQAIGGG